MDTVEWGSGRDPVEPLTGRLDPEPDQPQNRRGTVAIGGRWTALSLAGAGLAAMMASELLPWVHITASGSGNENDAGVSGALTFGLAGLRTSGVLAYRFATLGILGLLGALLLGRVRQRRAVFGAVAGLIAAQALNLVGMIHSFGRLLDDYLGFGRSQGVHTTIESGAYFAVIGLVLLLASLVMTAAPARVRTQLTEVMREPIDAEFTDEPFELTVTQAKPIDEAYFTRPDQRR